MQESSSQSDNISDDKLMMEDVMVNIALSTNGGKLCSFVVKSVVDPQDT